MTLNLSFIDDGRQKNISSDLLPLCNLFSWLTFQHLPHPFRNKVNFQDINEKYNDYVLTLTSIIVIFVCWKNIDQYC